MKTLLVCAFVALAGFAGTSAADVSPLSNAPAAYTPQTPVIQGRVVSVSDVGMVVDTHEGQRVQMMMDSRTMLPIDLDDNMEIRAEFKVLENGSFYAKRVIPIRSDQDAARHVAYAKTNSEALYASNDDDEDDDVDAQAVAYADNDRDDQKNTLRSDENAEHSTTTDADKDDDNDHMNTTEAEHPSDEALPETASSQPIVALFGAIALIGAGLIAWSRRPRQA